MGNYIMGKLDHEASARIRRVRELIAANGPIDSRIAFGDTPIVFKEDLSPPFLAEVNFWRTWSPFRDTDCPPAVFCGAPK